MNSILHSKFLAVKSHSKRKYNHTLEKKWKYFWKRVTIFAIYRVKIVTLFQEVKDDCIFIFLEWDFTARNLECTYLFSFTLIKKVERRRFKILREAS